MILSASLYRSCSLICRNDQVKLALLIEKGAKDVKTESQELLDIEQAISAEFAQLETLHDRCSQEK
jgi:hypothetical protein